MMSREYYDGEIEDGAGLIVWMMGMLMISCILFSAIAIIVYAMITGQVF